MKRANHLIEKIATIENLELAFWKAKKGKNGFASVEQYRNNLTENLYTLTEQIKTGNIKTGNHRHFTIYDPKEREICAASFPERILHHALMNVCHPVFERFQIYDSYASRLGKGVYAAIDRARIFHKTHTWFLKLDVRKHFETIDHQILKNQLAKQFKETTLLQIFDQIIKAYQTQNGKGLPIGNLTSQYFANHYLAVADHFIKEKLKVKAYVRYMDDMVLWENDKEKLLDLGKQLKLFFKNELQLVLKPFCLNKTEKGLPFLGYVLTKQSLHLNKRSRKRFRKKIVLYESNRENETWTEGEYQKHILPLLAFTKKADSYHFRKKIMQHHDF